MRVDAASIVGVERHGTEADGRKADVALGLRQRGDYRIAAGDVVAEFVEAQTAAQQQAAAQEAEALLRVVGAVGDVRVIAGVDSEGHAAFAWIEPDVDLVIVEVGAGGEQRLQAGDLVRSWYCVLAPS